MKIWDRINRWFNEVAQYHADKNTYHMHIEKLMGAVERNDAKLIQDGLEFLEPLSYRSKTEFDRLVHKAIETDHKESFSVLYNYLNDPNYNFSDMVNLGPGVGYELDVKSLLYKAIKVNSPNIALMLACDPAVDITKSGYHQMSYYGLYQNIQKQEFYPTPLVEAMKNYEMVDVASVLEKRTIELKIQEANKLKDSVLKRNR